MSSRPAAGGGRWVEVDPDRVARWVAGFADRPPGSSPATDLAGFVAAVTLPHRLGLLLVRKGAVAVGIAEGERLPVHKVDTRYVQGRTAAGGWSQQRFARRRDNQTKAALADAVELAVRLLLPVGRRPTVDSPRWPHCAPTVCSTSPNLDTRCCWPR